jgi:TPR repeat protein
MNTTQRGAIVYARARELLCADEPDQALPLLMEAIEKYDNPEAMFELAYAHLEGGWGLLEGNKHKARDLLVKASDLGYINATAKLCEMGDSLFIQNAVVTRIDNSNSEYAKSLLVDVFTESYSISPDTTCRYAQYLFGWHQKDDNQIVLRKSASSGFADAQLLLAKILFKSESTKKECYYWLGRALNQNHFCANWFTAHCVCFMEEGGNFIVGAKLVLRMIRFRLYNEYPRHLRARLCVQLPYGSRDGVWLEQYQYGKFFFHNYEILTPHGDSVFVYSSSTKRACIASIAFMKCSVSKLPKDIRIFIGKIIFNSRETHPKMWVYQHDK